jgi:hypothetical protein
LVGSTGEYEITYRDASHAIVRKAVPANGQRSAIEQIWANGGEIISVEPKQRTLEEVFLALTSRGDA